MNKDEFLAYSARENMTQLRHAFNQNQEIDKPTPDYLTEEQAKADIAYLKFVLEQGYSGYTAFPKEKFDEAFINIVSKINEAIDLICFMDRIQEALAFITDGHLALTASQHAVGFYRHQDTYVTDMRVTNECIETVGHIECLPSLHNGEPCRLIGSKSYEEIGTIGVTVDGVFKTLPAHKIKSSPLCDNQLITFQEIAGVAYVRCSTFVGDAESELERVYEIGKQCSRYQHVIWDLSHNLGGNAAFAERFIEGLNDICISNETVYQVQSSLVHAKETGEVKEIAYDLATFKEAAPMQVGSYKGHLHIIINERVASSGESALVMCDCIETKTVYGCNSLGIGTYGDLLIYYLPYSNITVWCPHKVFDNQIRETKGYSPDIWLDTHEPLQEILRRIEQVHD